MFDVVLRVIPPKSWVVEVSKRQSAPIFILDCLPFGESGGKGLIEIHGDERTKHTILKEIESHPDVLKIHISNDVDGRLSAAVVAKNWVACSTILKSDCFLRSARTVKGGKVEWNLLVEDESTLSMLVKDLKGAGCKVELVRKTMVKEHHAITKRQEYVLRRALESGYYDYPRRITARQLALKLKMAPSTLSEVLQRAEKRLAEYYFKHRL